MRAETFDGRYKKRQRGETKSSVPHDEGVTTCSPALQQIRVAKFAESLSLLVHRAKKKQTSLTCRSSFACDDIRRAQERATRIHEWDTEPPQEGRCEAAAASSLEKLLEILLF